jgi:hypothetical protein
MVPEAFVFDAIRTPRGRGRHTGLLHGIKPVSLVIGLWDELCRRNPELDPAAVDDLVMGIVSPIGDQGSVLPRTALMAAGWPNRWGSASQQILWLRVESGQHRRPKGAFGLGPTRHRRRAWSRCRGSPWGPTAAPG